MVLLRRRSDVLTVRRETDALPYEQAPEMAAEEEGPWFEPLRALERIRHRDLDPCASTTMSTRSCSAWPAGGAPLS